MTHLRGTGAAHAAQRCGAPRRSPRGLSSLPATWVHRPAWRLASAVLLPVVLLLSGHTQAQTLASIPVVQAAPSTGPAAPDPGQALRVRVHVLDADGLAKLLGVRDGAPPNAGFLDISLLPGAHPDVGSPADPLAASFVVDFDQPEVAALVARFREEEGLAPGVPADGARVVAFVHRIMKTDAGAHGQVASEVARTRRGVCQEFTLITAALSRAQRIPARIVHGAVLLQAQGQWQAFGHAWAQTFEAGRWQVRDSALADWPGPLYYLPSLVFTDEGPGQTLMRMQSLPRIPNRFELPAGAGGPAAQPAGG